MRNISLNKKILNINICLDKRFLFNIAGQIFEQCMHSNDIYSQNDFFHTIICTDTYTYNVTNHILEATFCIICAQTYNETYSTTAP